MLPPRVVIHNAAVRASPFLDGSVSGLFFDQRFSDATVFGLQLGAYLGEAVRVALRAELPSKSANDEGDLKVASKGAVTQDSDPAHLVYGGSLGVVAASSNSFVFSPGLAFARADVSAYGTMLGVSLPFDWVTDRGLHFGFELNVGRGFGGVQRTKCLDATCPASEVDRDAGRALALRFTLGYGFNRPQPARQ